MEIEIRIYYEDTDSGGVVYYANYLKYFERGRTEFLRARGVDLVELMSTTGIQFVVTRAELRYRRSGRYNDLIRLETRLIEAKRASFVFSCVARRGSEVLCEGETTLAAVDAAGRPCRVPEAVMAALTAPEPESARPS